MSRWKLRVNSSELGQARITVMDLGTPIGLINMPVHDYAQIVRRITQFVYQNSKEVIARSLEEYIWTDAVSKYMDTERAKEKMLEFGWTREKIETYADELSKNIVQKLIEFLPEHEG